MVVEINKLPPEILSLILENLDGYSFIQATRVCKKWHQLTQRLDQIVWEKACKEEIDLSILEELCGLRCIDDIHDKQIWKSVYAKWARGRMVKNAHSSIPFSKKTICGVNCIRHSGSWIVTGHENGSVCLWDITNEKRGLSIIIQHLSFVADLALVDLLRSGPYGSIDKPWDHHHVISVSEDNTVKLKYLLYEQDDEHVIHRDSCSLANVRIFGDHALVSTSDFETYLLFEMECKRKPLFSMSMTLKRKVVKNRELYIDFKLRHNEIISVIPAYKLQKYSIQRNEWLPDNPRLREHFGPAFAPLLYDVFYEKIVAFRNGIMFGIENGEMTISVEGLLNKQAILPSIGCGIIEIALKGSLLAFGTDSGRLLLYHVSCEDHFTSLEISYPSFNKHLDIGPLIHIDISDCNTSPIVIACSHTKMVAIQWHY